MNINLITPLPLFKKGLIGSMLEHANIKNRPKKLAASKSHKDTLDTNTSRKQARRRP